MARALLIAGAAVLIGTALFHMTGLSSAASWLPGERGRIVALLWTSAAFDWAVVGALWLYAGSRLTPALRWPVLLSALIPGAVAIMLIATVDPAHPGGYLLLLAAVLAIAGAWRLR